MHYVNNGDNESTLLDRETLEDGIFVWLEVWTIESKVFCHKANEFWRRPVVR